MLIIFSDKGIVYEEFVLAGQTAELEAVMKTLMGYNFQDAFKMEEVMVDCRPKVSFLIQ
jgi:hypothetical protein